MNLLLRVLMVLAGLVVAASIAAVGLTVFALWGVRSVWARLTGQPASPFVLRMRPFAGFESAMRRAQPQSASRTPRADAVAGARLADVTDVEPKRPVR
jgi:hypothetical protein